MVQRSELKARAKQSLQGKWGIAIGTTLVSSIILGAAGFTYVGPLLLSGVLEVGLAIVFLEIIRNWQCEFGDMFKGFNNFGTTCLAGILQSIFIFLWSLLFVIPGIVKAYSYSMTGYILADHPEMSPNGAITASRQMMDGHKFDLFVLHLSFIPWLLLCGITFGLAGLYVFPYMKATEAAFYDALKAQNEPACEDAPIDGDTTVL